MRTTKTVNRALLLVMLALWGKSSVVHAQAASPFAFSYGGRLTDANGLGVVGPLDMDVVFWNAATGGTQTGFFTKTGVVLEDGVFQVDLDMQPSEMQTIFGGTGAAYVQIVAGGKTYPRQRITAVPYALRVPVDEKTLHFNTDGKLAIKTPAPAVGFLKNDGAGNLTWASAGTGNGDMMGANNLSEVANDGTARTNIGAAASGANSDITSLTGLSTALSIGQGGTGATSANAALNALLPAQSAPLNGYVLQTNGTNTSWVAMGAAGEANTASNQGAGGVGVFKAKSGVDLQFRSVNAGSTKVTVTNDAGNNEIDVDVAEGNLTLDNLGGTLGFGKGGTGQTTANGALNAMLPSQTGNGGKVLSTGGTNTAWALDGVALGGAAAGMTNGSLLFVDGGLVSEDNANLKWDNTNNRLGVGVAPTDTLHVSGTFRYVDTNQGTGKVLTSDANGVASWAMPNDVSKLALAGGNMSGVLGITGGTASSPGLKVANDPSTGIYGSTGNIAFSTAGTSRMFIDSSGNVGIDGALAVREGGASPSYYTTIHGGDQTTNITYTLPAAQSAGVLTNNGSGTLSWAASATAAGSTNGEIQFKNGPGFAASSNLFWDNTNFRLGLGTTTPAKALHVHAPDNLSVIQFTNTSSTGGSGTDGSYIGVPSSADLVIKNQENANTIFWNNSVETMRLTPTGRLGIGHNGPNARLHVAENANTMARVIVENSDAGASAGAELFLASSGAQLHLTAFGSGSAMGPNAYMDFSSDLVFSTSGFNPVMALKNSGFVGIGTTNPASRLHVDTDGVPVVFENQVNDPYGASLSLQKNKIGSLAVSGGDGVGDIMFGGWDGSMVQNGAFVSATATQNWSGGMRGTKLSLWTTPINTNVPIENLHLEDGRVGIGTAGMPSAALQIDAQGMPGSNQALQVLGDVGGVPIVDIQTFSAMPAMFIDGSGKVAVGHNTPSQALDVQGSIRTGGMMMKFVSTGASSASPFSVMGDDYFVSNNNPTGGVVLPPCGGPIQGRVVWVKWATSGTSLTVTSGGGNVNGGSSDSITTAQQARQYVCDGTNWQVF